MTRLEKFIKNCIAGIIDYGNIALYSMSEFPQFRSLIEYGRTAIVKKLNAPENPFELLYLSFSDGHFEIQIAEGSVRYLVLFALWNVSQKELIVFYSEEFVEMCSQKIPGWFS